MSTPSSWFDDVIEAISETKATTTLISPQPSESIDTEEIFKSVSHRIPGAFTLSELVTRVNEFLSSSPNRGAKRTAESHVVAVLGILASLRSPAGQRELTAELSADGDLGPSPDNAAAAKELAIILAKGIAPVENHGETNTRTGSGDEDIDMVSVEEEETKKRQESNSLAQRCRSLAGPAISAIHELLLVVARSSNTDKRANTNTSQPLTSDLDEVLLTLIAYTNGREVPGGEVEEESISWTTPEIANQAETTLLLTEKLLFSPGSSSSRPRDEFIIRGILENYLRPLFSKTKRPTAITATGRKAAYSADNNDEGGLPDDSWVTKPWKFTDHRAIPVFAWAVDEADEPLITKQWPLFIPVLLTLVDDPSTNIRSRGLKILSRFLDKFHPKLLLDTGLAQVFEDAVFPTLSYLPSLTPERESAMLLAPAFEALRTLAHKQALSDVSSATTTTKRSGRLVGGATASTVTVTTAQHRENKLLDRALREGVFPAYFHAKEHVRIVEVLCQETALILQQMGIHAVKHLKDLIPMITSIMTNPFAPLSPTTLLAAIKALQATLATCWPRLPSSPWQDEILHSLVTCWLNVHDFEQDEQQKQHKNNITSSSSTSGASAAAAANIITTISDIKQQLTISASALSAVLKTGMVVGEGTASQVASSDQQQQHHHHRQMGKKDPLGELVAPLVSKEPLLAGLFSQSSQ